MKVCNKCNLEKEIIEFNKMKSSKDGYGYTCKSCYKDLYLRNKDIILRKLNKEKIKEYKKEYRKLNKEKISVKKKEWDLKNKEHNIKYNKEYRLKSTYKKNNTAKYKKEYRKLNKEKINEYYRNYIKNRKKSDIMFKLSSDIRSLILKTIKNGGYFKKSKINNIIGCSFEEFKFYIENQFEPWMNWDNNGKYTGVYNETWQYDHIIPVSSGISEEEILKLNHYTNFKPLCSRKNIEKGNKVIL